MPNFLSTVLKNDGLARLQSRELKFYIQQTAGTQSFISGMEGLAGSIIQGDTAGEFTQAAADALLGVSNDVVTATMFGATAMGTDSYGFILACQGQIQKLVYLQYSLWLATEVQNLLLGTSTAPSDALTEVAYLTPAGNIAGRLIPAGFDAGTGVLEVKMGVFLK